MANSTNVSYVPLSSPGPVMSSGSVGEVVGVRRADLGGQLGGVAPVGEALGLRADQGVQRRHVEARDGVVGRVGGHGQPVDGDLELDVLDAVLLARAISSSLIGREASAMSAPPVAERGEAVAGAGTLDGHRQAAARHLVGELTDADADRLDGRRAGDEDVALGELDVAAGRRRAAARPRSPRPCASAVVGRRPPAVVSAPPAGGLGAAGGGLGAAGVDVLVVVVVAATGGEDERAGERPAATAGRRTEMVFTLSSSVRSSRGAVR